MKLIKAPFSGGSLGKNLGCEKAPDAILAELKSSDHTINLNLDNSNIESSFQAIQETIASLDEKFILVGGDHSITYPSFLGFLKNNPRAGLLVLDAHADSVNNFDPPTHEDFIKTLIERGVPPENIVLVGIRGMHKIEADYLKRKNVQIFHMTNCHEVGITNLTTAIMEFCSKYPSLYLSIDIDVADPAFAPGTGYLEPGGLSSRELLQMVQRIGMMRKLRGADLVEVNPDKDINEMTIKLAARIVHELNKTFKKE